MTVVDVLARIDEIHDRIRSFGLTRTDAAATPDASARATAGDFASAVQRVIGTGALAGGDVTGSDIVDQAMNYLGVPYVFAGEDETGMDCSGLVQRVLADLGIDAPRVVKDQMHLGVEVGSLAEAQPGDLLVTHGAAHIVIYAGDGKIIHAPSPGKFVELRDNYLRDGDILTIRRVVAAPAPAATGSGGAALFAAAAAAAPAAAGARDVANLLAAVSGTSPTAAARTATGVASLSAAASTFTTLAARSADTASGILAPGAAEASRPATAADGSRAASAAAAAAALRSMVAESAADQPSAAAPVGGPAPAAATTPGPAAPVPAAARATATPLAPQISAPVLSLVGAGDGDHTLTLRVSPENLGPITVKAHISGAGITIELTAPSDAGRDALRAVMVDLRRDLAALAPHATLSLAGGDPATPGGSPWSSGSGTPGGAAGQPGSSNQPSQPGQVATGASGRGIPHAAPDDTAAAATVSPHSGIDLFA